MECPHLSSIGVAPSAAVLDRLQGALGKLRRERRTLQCSECGSEESVWICAGCGAANCGRYVKAHGLRHFEKVRQKHPVCMDARETAVFCYLCDDFILNDTPDEKLQALRERLQEFNRSFEVEDKAREEVTTASLSPADNRSLRPRRKRASLNISEERRRSTSSPGSSSSSSRGARRSSTGGAENRPAKVARRESSSSAKASPSAPSLPSSSSKSSKVKGERARNLVGLRNLGNTCFMSAVLQSLGNIHEFCRVLKQLPALDGAQLASGGGGGGSASSSLHPASSASPSASSSNSEASNNGYSASPSPSVPYIAGLSSPAVSGGGGGGKRETRSAGLSDSGPIMTDELRKVLIALSQGQKEKKTISPEALFHVIWKVVPRFRGYQQQDAHEFLRYMLDRLHTELLALLPGDLGAFLAHSRSSASPYSRRVTKGALTSSQSLVTSVFGGTLQSEVSCLGCGTPSKKHDPFLDLSIDIPSQFSQLRASKAADKAGEDGKADGEQRPRCSVHDCLTKFTDVEELGESERFFCNRCGRKQPSTKKFWIRRLPNVLCLHIKRFRWTIFSRTKIDTHVEFPLEGLDMSPYLLDNLHETRCSNAGSCLYDLAAVIVHHGSGAGSGHYTAFVTKNSQWYHFNDSQVLAADADTVARCKAYILFYIQREFRLPNT